MNLIKNFWQKSWWSKLILIIGSLFLFFSIIGLLSPEGQKSFQKGYEAGKKVGQPSTPTPETLASPSPYPTISAATIESTAVVEISPTGAITSTLQQRKLVMGSTPIGVEFYKKVESLHQQGVVYGELYTEHESDAIVDVNPDMQSVQLSLKYSTIIDKVDEADKKLILNDFNKIKTLAEQDSSLILPDYGSLRLFVLTFHDKAGKARGELEQMMIDNEPQWSDWK